MRNEGKWRVNAEKRRADERLSGTIVENCQERTKLFLKETKSFEIRRKKLQVV